MNQMLQSFLTIFETLSREEILESFVSSFGKLFTFITLMFTVTYSLSRYNKIARLMTTKRSERGVKVVLFLIMSLLIMLASHIVIRTPEGGRMNVRDMFAILAGLLGGPLIGISVGIIGGLYRYFLGGPTALGCSIATSIAGVLGGYLYRFKQFKLPEISFKAINTLFFLTLLMEIFHLIISNFVTEVFIPGVSEIEMMRTATPAEFLDIITSGAAMILINPIGVAIFMLVFRGLGLEQLRIQKLIEEKEAVKEAKEEIEKLKSALEIKVKARTQELENLTKSLEKQVKERTKELQKRIDELERFHKLTVGRELRMTELKREIKELKKELKKRGG
jgi:LytS/YehU family sensor histidine kinase